MTPSSPEATALLGRLRCPSCSFQSVLDSQAPLAQDMRHFVTESLAHGASEDWIVGYLTHKYGQAIHLDPGWMPETWLLWGAPIFLSAALLILGILWYRR